MLCQAWKGVDKDMHQEWCQQYQVASIFFRTVARYRRKQQILQLLGATVIKHRLQGGILDIIQCLKE